MFEFGFPHLDFLIIQVKYPVLHSAVVGPQIGGGDQPSAGGSARYCCLPWVSVKRLKIILIVQLGCVPCPGTGFRNVSISSCDMS